MMSTEKKVTIRELMPKGYLALLALRTKRKPQYISEVVLKEHTGSPIWPDILKLAEETKRQRQEEADKLNALKSVA